MVTEMVHVCSKCGGSGELPQFYHYAQGVCFQCGGLGIQKSKPRGSVAIPLTKADMMRKDSASLEAYLPILHRELEASNTADRAKGITCGTNTEKVWNHNISMYQRRAIERAKREGFWEQA